MATKRCTFVLTLFSVMLKNNYNNSRTMLPVKYVLPTKSMSDVLFEGTSLNCTGSAPENKTCHFRNLCYLHSRDVFVYIHSVNSQETYADGNGKNALTNLPLTPVVDLDIFFRYTNVTSQQLRLNEDDFIFKPGNYIVYTRFIANHVMSIFHSELIPLYYTLLRFFDKNQLTSIRLFIKDINDIGNFAVLYNIFSSETPLFSYELELEVDGTLICFQEATIGLVRESLWHQHGLKGPEGPIQNSPVTAKHIRQFTSFLKQKLGIYPDCPKEDYGILLSRKKNRLLLNEKELKSAISNEIQLKMIELSLDQYSLLYIIEKVSCSRLVVGVHGALLIVAMFLPTSSMLVEIFPYAVNPDHRTAYRTLTQLPGMDISYGYWRNVDKTKTVTHPFTVPKYGGISHLPLKEQERIKNLTEVPHDKNGRDPEWRFHLYQDTVIDIPAVIRILKERDFGNLSNS